MFSDLSLDDVAVTSGPRDDTVTLRQERAAMTDNDSAYRQMSEQVPCLFTDVDGYLRASDPAGQHRFHPPPVRSDAR